ncbi:MAG: hypothetical protein LBN32_01975 [Helicobacteraceae bacterium]|jgi:hypothetical protein|nr:hypothetical protein [Helicobacteraceae bacterium]
MTAGEFLSQLNAISNASRGVFSGGVLRLSKLSAAEAIGAMLKYDDFAVKINAIKAIRKFELDLYEKELIKLLIDNSEDVRVAALKSLCSFGKKEHFKLAKAFYNENVPLRYMIIDSFVNFSDQYEAHVFMFNQLDSANEKIKNCALEWFEKAFDRDIFLPWISSIYDEAPYSLRYIFEDHFAHRLKLLFGHPQHGYRFKLIYLAKKEAL